MKNILVSFLLSTILILGLLCSCSDNLSNEPVETIPLVDYITDSAMKMHLEDFESKYDIVVEIDAKDKDKYKTIEDLDKLLKKLEPKLKNAPKSTEVEMVAE